MSLTAWYWTRMSGSNEKTRSQPREPVLRGHRAHPEVQDLEGEPGKARAQLLLQRARGRSRRWCARPRWWSRRCRRPAPSPSAWAPRTRGCGSRRSSSRRRSAGRRPRRRAAPRARTPATARARASGCPTLSSMPFAKKTLRLPEALRGASVAPPLDPEPQLAGEGGDERPRRGEATPRRSRAATRRRRARASSPRGGGAGDEAQGRQVEGRRGDEERLVEAPWPWRGPPRPPSPAPRPPRSPPTPRG